MGLFINNQNISNQSDPTFFNRIYQNSTQGNPPHHVLNIDNGHSNFLTNSSSPLPITYLVRSHFIKFCRQITLNNLLTSLQIILQIWYKQ